MAKLHGCPWTARLHKVTDNVMRILIPAEQTNIRQNIKILTRFIELLGSFKYDLHKEPAWGYLEKYLKKIRERSVYEHVDLIIELGENVAESTPLRTHKAAAKDLQDFAVHVFKKEVQNLLYVHLKALRREARQGTVTSIPLANRKRRNISRD